MRRVRKQNLKLRLLALVLALLLLWYSINPAPPVIVRHRRRNDDEDQDAERRDAEHEITLSTLPARFYRPQPWETPNHLPSSSSPEEDDFDWPEFIDG